MIRRAALTLALCLAANDAPATTFSYAGTALSPSLLGGTGGKAITFSFSAAKPPAAGKCVQALKLTKYADGARTLGSLRKAGFRIIHSSDTGPITFATLCLGKDGTTLSGVYELTISRNLSTFTDTYYITNGTGSRTDQLDLYVYAGAVPAVYEDVSATPGAWTITP